MLGILPVRGDPHGSGRLKDGKDDATEEDIH
jgi:hypothetical protein